MNGYYKLTICAAYRQVIKNKGSAGVDGVKVGQLKGKIRKDYPQLKEDIRNGKYLSLPIFRMEIPKGKGKTRLLGIPTTTDRILQQAVAQVLMPKWEPDFSNNSYDFHLQHNARQAVGKALGYINGTTSK